MPRTASIAKLSRSGSTHSLVRGILGLIDAYAKGLGHQASHGPAGQAVCQELQDAEQGLINGLAPHFAAGRDAVIDALVERLSDLKESPERWFAYHDFLDHFLGFMLVPGSTTKRVYTFGLAIDVMCPPGHLVTHVGSLEPLRDQLAHVLGVPREDVHVAPRLIDPRVSRADWGFFAEALLGKTELASPERLAPGVRHQTLRENVDFTRELAADLSDLGEGDERDDSPVAETHVLLVHVLRRQEFQYFPMLERLDAWTCEAEAFDAPYRIAGREHVVKLQPLFAGAPVSTLNDAAYFPELAEVESTLDDIEVEGGSLDGMTAYLVPVFVNSPAAAGAVAGYRLAIHDPKEDAYHPGCNFDHVGESSLFLRQLFELLFARGVAGLDVPKTAQPALFCEDCDGPLLEGRDGRRRHLWHPDEDCDGDGGQGSGVQPTAGHSLPAPGRVLH